MDRLQFKKQVLEAAREKQQKLIDDFRTRINEIRKSQANINEDQFDSHQESFDDQAMTHLDNLADQLNFAVDEIDILNKMEVEDRLHDQVVPGSIVKTDKRTFYPSVSLERFRVNGEELFGVSSKAPIYQAMKGKKKGDTFEVRGEQYKILEIY